MRCGRNGSRQGCTYVGVHGLYIDILTGQLLALHDESPASRSPIPASNCSSRGKHVFDSLNLFSRVRVGVRLLYFQNDIGDEDGRLIVLLLVTGVGEVSTCYGFHSLNRLKPVVVVVFVARIEVLKPRLFPTLQQGFFPSLQTEMERCESLLHKYSIRDHDQYGLCQLCR
jgi:hypothetical protein